LLGTQFDFDDLLDLVWKLAKNLLLAAAQRYVKAPGRRRHSRRARV
jgi:hypothetical protein